MTVILLSDFRLRFFCLTLVASQQSSGCVFSFLAISSRASGRSVAAARSGCCEPGSMVWAQRRCRSPGDAAALSCVPQSPRTLSPLCHGSGSGSPSKWHQQPDLNGQWCRNSDVSPMLPPKPRPVSSPPASAQAAVAGCLLFSSFIALRLRVMQGGCF